jgi:hypothetical protein
MFLAWAILGALIGVAAAQKRGFSVVGGVLGGLMLGPLAFLLFFVSGVTSADASNKKCLACAEWIKGEATVCKHCHTAVAPIAARPSSGVRPVAVRPPDLTRRAS